MMNDGVKMNNLIITAPTMVDLRAKIYAAEGWKAVRGENKIRRMMAIYNIEMSARDNRFVATRKN
jgi:hypothetical protein